MYGGDIMENLERTYCVNDIIKNLCNTDESSFKDCIGYIRSSNSVDKLLTDDETILLTALEKLYKDLGSVPSFEVFKTHYPSFKVESNVEVTDVLAITRVFIKQRKKLIASKLLMNEANIISTEGITPKIVERISNILKSDAIEIKYENIEDKIVDIYEKSIDNSGIKTGIEQIDEMIGGLKAGQVSVIGGFTGMGKSISSVSIMHSALEQGFNVCYLSLELSAEHLMYNLISRHSLESKFSRKIEHRDLKFKALSEDDWCFVKDKIIPDLKELPGRYYILDEQDIEAYNDFAFDNKLQEIENLCIKETGKGLDLLIVDHIQMFAYSNQDSKLSENTIINRWCNYFRSNCLDFLKSKRQIHVILVAQINRQGYRKALKNNGMYDLTALKEANELETCASVILGVFSDPALIASNQVRIGIMKNRDGNRSFDAYTCPADYAYQLVGRVGSAIDPLSKDGNMMSNFEVFENDFGDDGFTGFTFVDPGQIDLSPDMEG